VYGATLVAGAALAGTLMGQVPDDRSTPRHAELVRGRYLAQAADCAACHTAPGGPAFAGGRAVPTPFGNIYASNITPDKATGIGGWTDVQFWNAMHEGRSADGHRLYPAMPYPWYTRLGRDDVRAIKAYLDTVKPVRNEVKRPDLPWPVSWRGGLAVWDALFFRPGVYQTNPDKSAEWNLGAYLVEGAGHCGACHSPKNVLGAVKRSERFEGGKAEGWYATALRPGASDGLGNWSVDDIVDYLATGANSKVRAMGAMAEVIQDSTSHLSRTDLRAIAVYLKDLPSSGHAREAGTASTEEGTLTRGRLVYADQCAGCHMQNGSGVPNVFPALGGNPDLNAPDVTSIARLVLEGAPSARTPARPEGFAMPAFGYKLTDAEIADVLTYARASFGNHSGPVTADTIAQERRSLVAGD
jgi:mono/diheme cytochrome c family protein